LTPADASKAPEDLLSAFSADPGEAVRKYSALRRKLICVCAQRGCPDPEGAAAAVFERVIQKLKSGTELTVPLEVYCMGVARNVAREEIRKRRPQVSFEEDFHGGSSINDPDEIVLVRECLDLLKKTDRDFILDFYREGAIFLAESLGVTPNAVRIRAHKIVKSIKDSLNGLPPAGKKK